MTYSEMNEKIVGILRISDQPAVLYAADRIEELERRVAELEKAAAGVTFYTPDADCDIEYIMATEELRRVLEQEGAVNGKQI